MVLVEAVQAVAVATTPPDRSPDYLAWITLFAVAAQAIFLALAFLGDMRRRRKQSSLEMWHAAMDGCTEIRRAVAQEFKRDALTKTRAKELFSTSASDADKKIREELTDYLNILERVAVGAKLRIYDEGVIYQIGRKTVCDASGNYRAFITEGRIERGNPRLYKDLESLASAFEARFKKEQPREGFFRRLKDGMLPGG